MRDMMAALMSLWKIVPIAIGLIFAILLWDRDQSGSEEEGLNITWYHCWGGG